MSDAGLHVLLAAAAGVALLHAAVGVDHYLPFVVLARAQRWSLRKLVTVTGLCGVGHVLGSLLLGTVGIAAGVALGSISWLESLRGSLAAWLLIGFGLAYAAWATWRALRGRRHAHAHAHADGTLHTHDHDHHGAHAHGHGDPARTATFWSLFVIFVLGPCEPLVPLLTAPASGADWWGAAAVAGVFGGVTVATMTGLSVLGWYGMQLAVFERLAPVARLERWGNTLAGVAIAASGVAIVALGV